MDKVIEELQKAIKDNALSQEAAARYVGCSWPSIQRWLSEKLIPSRISKQKIRAGLAKINKAFPEKKSIYQQSMEARELYRKVKAKISYQEKEELFDINQSDGLEVYIKRLEELIEQYKPDMRQVQMFRPVDEKGEEQK